MLSHPVNAPENKVITKAIWLASDTAAIESWFNLPSINASDALTNAVRSDCKASGIARLFSSLLNYCLLNFIYFPY